MTEKRIRALVIISASWIKESALEVTFKDASLSTERLIIPVTAYDMTSGAFVEITFHPQMLNDRWVKVLVPNSGVLSIIELENPEDIAELGFGTLGSRNLPETIARK